MMVPYLHMHDWKNLPGGLAGKELEAALRVVDVLHSKNVHQDVKRDHQKVPDQCPLFPDRDKRRKWSGTGERTQKNKKK